MKSRNLTKTVALLIVGTILFSFQQIKAQSLCLANYIYTIQSDSSSSSGSHLIVFTNQSTGNNLSYFWDFGDSTTSNLQSPSKTFQSSGLYNVCLTVSNQFDSNCYSVNCKQIQIGAMDSNQVTCHALFDYYMVTDSLTTDSSFIDTTALNSIGFINLSTGNNLSYFWDFGDSTTSNLQSPSKTFQSPGLYNVCLTVSNQFDSNCYSTNCKQIQIGAMDSNQVICHALFDYYMVTDSLATDSTFIDTTTASNSIGFINLSTGNNLSYFWDFGDNTTSNLQSPSKTFQSSGLYHVCLTVSNQFDSNCYSIYCKEVKIGKIDSSQVACKAMFDYYNTSSNIIKFVNQSTGNNLSYFWNFGDSTFSTVESPIKTCQYNKLYNVCLIVSNLSKTCWNSYCKQISIGNDTNQFCTALFEHKIEIDSLSNPPSQKINFINLSKGNNLSYQWSFGDFTSSNLQSPSKVYQNFGIYDVCLYVFSKTDSNCSSRTCQRIAYGALQLNVVEKSVYLKLNNIYPVPASNEVNLEIFSLEAGKLNIVVSDLTGKVCVSKVNNVERGDNKVKIDVDGLNGGVYLIEISNEKGKVFQKMIK